MEERRDSRSVALRKPVDLSEVDCGAAQDRAAKFARIGAELASRSSGSVVNADVLVKLCVAATGMVHDRSARLGMRLNGLCAAAGIGEGHVREHFTPAFLQAATLAVRLMQAEISTPVLYDVIVDQLVDTREAQSLGAFDGGLRLLYYGSVSASTSLVDDQIVFTSGTPHDRNDACADHQAIARFQKQMRNRDRDYVLPATPVEHLAQLLRPHERLRDLARRSSRLVAASRLPAGVDLAHVFPDVLVVPTLSTGRRLPDRDVGVPYHPGRDREARQLVSSLGRPALLALGPMSLDAETVERDFPQTHVLWRGWQNAFGAGAFEYGVEYRANRNVLVRSFSQQHEDGHVGVSCEGWALVNLPVERRGQAVEICEHRCRETWHLNCLSEYRNRTEPGLLQASHPIVRAGMQASGCIGNAANVTLDRLNRQNNSAPPRG